MASREIVSKSGVLILCIPVVCISVGQMRWNGGRTSPSNISSAWTSAGVRPQTYVPRTLDSSSVNSLLIKSAGNIEIVVTPPSPFQEPL